MRVGPGGGQDAVNNVSPEMSKARMVWSQKYEDVFINGHKLWASMKKRPDTPKKIYFIGTNGNLGEEVAESMMDALAYVPAPDGTFFLDRKPGMDYPKIKYHLMVTDKMVASKSKISSVDLFMEDEEKYRDLEVEALKEFAELEEDEYPMGCVVGESALLRKENTDLMKKGLVIWLDVDSEYSWMKTQHRPQQGSGLYIPQDFSSRPPVWAIANGWDGDVDDTEGKLEYCKILKERNKEYEEFADLRLRTDVAGIAENSVWGASRLIKAMSEMFGLAEEEEVGVEEEIMERDLAKFLEGARLSKYMKPAMKWCTEMGAASIEDVVDSVPEFIEALKLKPLEKKRLQKAAASVATAA